MIPPHDPSERGGYFSRRCGADRLPDFTCAICQRRVDMQWTFRVHADTSLPPICIGWERWYSEGIGKPTAGSIRDRREVRRGFALAEALHNEAARQKWSATHASA